MRNANAQYFFKMQYFKLLPETHSLLLNKMYNQVTLVNKTFQFIVQCDETQAQ